MHWHGGNDQVADVVKELDAEVDVADMVQISAANSCVGCKNGTEQPFPFSMAFQPIVDVNACRVYAYEALVRGTNGESAYSILSQVTPENRYAFDQGCRVKAITLAAELGLEGTGARLSINFMPGAIYSPAACIQLTLKTAREVGFPLNRLIFELTEGEEVTDPAHLLTIFREYHKHGFRMALDDFGAGYCGLNLLANVAPDVIKMDMELTRNLHQRSAAFTIVKTMVQLARNLNADLVAEGVETVEEYDALRSAGVSLMQGYLLARPQFEVLPDFTLPRPMPFTADARADALLSLH